MKGERDNKDEKKKGKRAERRKEFVFLYLKLNHALKQDKSETYTLNSKTWLKWK